MMPRRRIPLTIQYHRDANLVTFTLKSEWLLLVFSICIALALAEIGARLWLREVLCFPSYQTSTGLEVCEEPGDFNLPRMVFDTYLGYVPQPNSSGNGYHINSEGFRDPEDIQLQPSRGEVRVFITGGSTAWSPGAPRQELTIGGLLQSLLNTGDSTKRVRVINTAVPGYCLTQERIMIENRILNYHPKVVLMFTGFNELAYAYCGVNTLVSQDHSTWRSRIDGCIRAADGAILPPVPLTTDYKWKFHYLLDKAIWNLRLGERRNHIWIYSI
jgi:hypothetical protein